MRVLVIWSSKNGAVVPFISEQIGSLNEAGIKCKLLIVKGGGIVGYIKSYFKIFFEVFTQKPNTVHAHFGLIGFVSTLLPFRPVIITFHGSDIMSNKTRLISKIAAFLSSESIFVSDTLKQKAKIKKGHVIPCGIDTEFFRPFNRIASRDRMKIDKDAPLILFGSNKKRPEKNYKFAERSFKIFKEKYSNAQMICLDGFDRKEVALLLNASDVAFLTSKWEGSPQFIKEALSTSTPIVAANVGDIKEQINKVEASYIFNESTSTPKNVASLIEKAYLYRREKLFTNGREKISSRQISLQEVAEKIIRVYQKKQ